MAFDYIASANRGSFQVLHLAPCPCPPISPALSSNYGSSSRLGSRSRCHLCSTLRCRRTMWRVKPHRQAIRHRKTIFYLSRRPRIQKQWRRTPRQVIVQVKVNVVVKVKARMVLERSKQKQRQAGKDGQSIWCLPLLQSSSSAQSQSALLAV